MFPWIALFAVGLYGGIGAWFWRKGQRGEMLIMMFIALIVAFMGGSYIVLNQ